MYPSSSAVSLNFDENMVCTGCQVGLEKVEIDWDTRQSMLLELVTQYKNTDSKYDCIIPVSGGKDSYFQTHLVTKELKLNPLLVTYNGNNYTQTGLKNVQNMREIFDVDHIFLHLQ